ncbi:MAG: glutathione S-transferase [Alphaproteobacteria bacterium]|jgi:glutathione S-transferase|nr:glutathione S-transferase [Alphaproteobacteria bacterium]MBT4019338.1 glutathione S-transferase [Alphaproteobacteria bacterium]MBT4966695.1 glutathione S-transferase [Alphaproteobacteria bacterium]MBT5161940.1 glutathione S-transferase [Alphaproteobacteria bacterium]MBT5920030.1 glutathione S-transferase [Alphaproteobacteria bacterium]
MTDAIETLDIPILYSFRRCPYAMRARLSLAISGQSHALREVILRDKPAAMITASPKATVPVLVLPDGTVLEQSLEIMDWALGLNDPENWLVPEAGTIENVRALIAESDGPFKENLDRYKYANRYEGADPIVHRTEGMKFLQKLDVMLDNQPFLAGQRACLADFAIFPFIRQFANTDRNWFDAQDLKPLQSWLNKHLASDLFTGVMNKWPQWKPGDAETHLP